MHLVLHAPLGPVAKQGIFIRGGKGDAHRGELAIKPINRRYIVKVNVEYRSPNRLINMFRDQGFGDVAEEMPGREFVKASDDSRAR